MLRTIYFNGLNIHFYSTSNGNKKKGRIKCIGGGKIKKPIQFLCVPFLQPIPKRTITFCELEVKQLNLFN